MRKARLVPVIVGAILLAASLVVFSLPTVVTDIDETYTLEWLDEKTYTLQPKGELLLEFTWLGYQNSSIIIDSGGFLGRRYVFLNSYQPTDSIYIMNTGSTEKTYTVDLLPLDGDVSVHAVVKNDVSDENALAGTLLFIFGLVFITLAAIRSRKQVRESRSGRRTIQTLGIIFVATGMIAFFLFPLGLLIPFFNVGMIIIGVEMIMIAGRVRDYS